MCYFPRAMVVGQHSTALAQLGNVRLRVQVRYPKTHLETLSGLTSHRLWVCMVVFLFVIVLFTRAQRNLKMTFLWLFNTFFTHHKNIIQDAFGPLTARKSWLDISLEFLQSRGAHMACFYTSRKERSYSNYICWLISWLAPKYQLYLSIGTLC